MQARVSSGWRRLSALGFLILALSAIAACGGDDEPAAPPPCPVRADVCSVGLDLLPAVRSGDAEAVASEVALQELTCPGTPVSDDPVTAALATACGGQSAGTEVEVYELHNGKAPFYFLDHSLFVTALTDAFTAVGVGDDFQIVAVGCGATAEDGLANCETGAVVLYGRTDETGVFRGDLTLAVVLSRPGREDSWAIERVWLPFPSTIPAPVPEQFSTAINSAGGVRWFELVPYGVAPPR